MIPYGKQNINQNDIEAVLKVLESDFITQGPVVPEFEKKISNYCKSKYAVAVNSATSALHIACKALDLKSGDIAWTSPNTFVASSNCVLYCDAKIDFVDIDPLTGNISIEKLEEKLIKAKKENKLPKVVIPVHMTGEPCDMQSIDRLRKEYNFKVIEDASHAIGAKHKGSNIGDCKYSDIVVFSFHPVKIITTAEGGMACTNSEKLFNKMNLLRSHGITRDPNMMNQKPHGSWYYQQIEIGFNYRMTEIQAALGYSQMDRIDSFIKKRHEIASVYDSKLSNLPLKLPYRDVNNFSSLHLYVIRLQIDNKDINHKFIFESLRDNGIGVNLHYIPVHYHPYYMNLGFEKGMFPESEKYYDEAISIPLHPSLDDENIHKVITTITNLLS
jgi:UDP-4-amino-4,6-dideoxy-N-acetyl-beta-L-altrosamine transaminase